MIIYAYLFCENAYSGLFSITMSTSALLSQCDSSVSLVPFHGCCFDVQFCKCMFNISIDDIEIIK